VAAGSSGLTAARPADTRLPVRPSVPSSRRVNAYLPTRLRFGNISDAERQAKSEEISKEISKESFGRKTCLAQRLGAVCASCMQFSMFFVRIDRFRRWL